MMFETIVHQQWLDQILVQDQQMKTGDYNRRGQRERP